MTVAVVLAAGRGVRLGSIAVATPKPLVAVAGVPAIDRILTGLAGAGTSACVVVTGHRGDEVEAHVRRSSPLPVTFVRQDAPLGTGHALLAARASIDGSFLFTWADIIVDAAAYAAVAAAPGDGALAVNHLDDLSAGAAVFVDDNRVTRIVEKPAISVATTWNNAGIGRLDRGIWPHVAALAPSPRGELELPEAIDAWVTAGASITAVAVTGPWFDIGTPAGLGAATDHLA
jgi:NDP-sugar pyrophosphorylase family protein